jgi:hypothetical protein
MFDMLYLALLCYPADVLAYTYSQNRYINGNAYFSVIQHHPFSKLHPVCMRWALLGLNAQQSAP